MPNHEPSPPVDDTHAPRMYEMDWQRFERLTVDLFSYEPGISTSDDYGVSGQTDHGVDVIARRGDGEEVASCKNRQEIRAKDLAGWSDDFLKHWESNWRKRSIKRFVLATTARNTGDRHVQNQVTEERERFKRLGVTYELWGPKQFVHKLRPYRALAARYLGESWAGIICGTTSEIGVRAGTSSLVPASAIAQVAELQERLSGQAANRAEQALNDLRAGRIDAVRALLMELREERTWSQLVPAVQAKTLRLAASVALRDSDLEQAASLDDEAEALSPAEEARIPAQIALERDGVDAAITRLGTVKSPAGKRLLASLLVMKRDVTALQALISELIATDPNDPDTLRLSALHELLKGDRTAALAQIRRAEARAADWRGVLQAGVIIRYAYSLSPAISADWLLYPNPVDIALVRGGDDVQAHLSGALALLDRLELTADHPENSLWRLAILANRRNGHVEATTFASGVLANEPGEATTVAWCLVRRFGVELGPSIAALEAEYAAGTDPFRTRVFGMLLASTLDAGVAAARLKEHLDIQGSQAKAEAERWIQRLEGQFEGPPADADDWLRAALQRLHDADRSAPTEFLRRAFSTHPPHPNAIILVQAIADLGRWELLDGWIQDILEIDTPAAVRVAAFAASRQDDAARVLTIINSKGASFGGALPPDLRRLRADALLRVGQVTAAMQEADQIAATTSRPEDRLFRAEILVNIGDLRSGAGAVREALRQDRLLPAQALKWAYLLYDEDPELARQLWRRAVSAGVEEDLVVAALHQAFELGLDDEVSQLMPMVHARATSGAPDIRMLDINEAVDVIARQRESYKTIENLYLSGALPVHVYMQGRLGGFAQLYMGRRHGDAGQLLVRLIRHGSRPRALDFSPWRDWQIHLDVTGFLEASRIGLLDELELHPNRVRVSHRLPLLLVEMQKAVRTAQPSLIKAKRRLLDGLNDGSIAERDVAPKGSILIGTTTEEGRRDVVSLVGALRTAGYLAPAEAEKRLEALGGGVPAEDIILTPGGVLHFEGHALEQAAAAGLLDALMRSFAVTVDAGLGEQAKRALAADQENHRLADVLGGLRERLSDGIQSGRYQLLEPDQADSYEGEDLLLGSLRDILRAPAVENGIAWIDDRFLTSYARMSTMPILGVVDALHAMQGAGTIDGYALSRRIGDLRRSGALFIPFESEEVADALLQAPVVGGQIVESEPLTTLRRSLAAAGRLERHLKLGEAKGNLADRPDEIEYPRSVMRLLPDVLEQLWKSAGQSDDELFARSDWLWANARFTRTNRDPSGPDPEAAQDAFEVMQIAHCFDKAFEIGGLDDERSQHRLKYLQWVGQRIVRPRLYADSGLLIKVADYLSRFYAGLLHSHQGAVIRRDQILQRLLVLRVVRLPHPLRDLLAQKPAFRVFFKTVQRIAIGQSRFEQLRFWRAVRAALRFGKSQLRDVEGRRVRMRRDGDVIVVSGAARARLHDPILDAVAARPRNFLAALGRIVRTFDIDDDGAKALQSIDLDKVEPHVLAARLEAERTRSYAEKFKKIGDNLRQRRSFPGDIFDPNEVEPFLSYLGIRELEAAPDLHDLFATLSDRHSAHEAFRRLSGIPVAPAGGFGQGAENPEAFAALASTPVSLVHAAAIARRQHREDLAMEIVDRLVRTIADYGDMFVAILRWTEKAFYRSARWRTLSLPLRLACAWAFADRLTATFISAGSSPNHAKAFFWEHPPPVSVLDVMQMQRDALDQASPRLLSAPVLLFHGLGAIFGSERLDQRLPEELIKRVRELLLARADAPLPHVTLMLRRSENPDALGSFMRATPAGLLPDDLDLSATRQAQIDGSLKLLETDGQDAEAAWNQLAALAAGGLAQDEQRRYTALLRRADLWSLGFDGLQPNFIRWRALIAPAAAVDAEWAANRLADLAGACRKNLNLRNGDTAFQALCELVETAAIVVAASYGEGQISFEDLLCRVVFEWPECAPMLRTVVDNMLAHTPPARGRQLWDLHLLLRTFR